ncbi:hypothetical protein B0H39_003215 [Clostridium beijerinckii]|uniref:hypothetical protein n=1 Tax=Clostridium beijerinckii TaxID=1520 RepID=UPI001494F47E|nr:hypothetical protein [Clostridium beijerinckii]NOW85334.1 hypothetical protein [Clostridium beijerinckii]
MKDKLIKKLKRFNCPNEYLLDCKCVEKCTKEQMKDCWDKTFEKYELLVSNEPIYKFQCGSTTFAFKKRGIA